jgi:cell wall-associated NlpC family hydrolase
MQFEGGIPMHPNELYAQENDLTQWWNYYPYSRRISLTWRVVDSFWTYVQNRGEFQIYNAATNDISILKRGDLIFMDVNNDGIFDHLKVVIGNGYMSPYSQDYYGGSDLSGQWIYGVMTDGHTNDRWHVPWDFAYIPFYRTMFVKVIPP